MDEWDKQAERVSSTFNAITGETMPSGTPFRQAAILNQEAGSMFEYRREEAGLFIQELYNEWILPWLVSQIKKDKELTATLEPEELELVSEAVAAHEALRFAKDQILGGKLVQQTDLDGIKAAARESSMKLRRKSFTGFADIFEGYEGLVDVVTTGEQKNKAAILETLFNAMKFVVGMQLPDGRNLAMEDGPLRTLFFQLIEAAGVSPVLFQTRKAALPSTPAPQANAALPENLVESEPVAA